MKKLLYLIITTLLVLSFSAPVFAAEWKSDAKGWWYVKDDGTYPVNTWLNIGGKDYYFGADGYLLVSTTTPDGFKVDANGEKIMDAAAASVQTKSGNSQTATVQTTAVPAKSESTGKTFSYVLNTNTKKFHVPTCGSVSTIKDKNRKDFTGSRDEVINSGYVPCKKCNP